MNNKTLVSVIIPNYNYEKTLPKCFEALMNQTYKNFEIIFVDDGSTDNSIEIAKKYPCKIYKTPKNGGVAVARNLGVEYASGDILFFLDSDVALYKDALENTLKEFDKDPALGSVCGIYSKDPLFKGGLAKDYRTLQGHYWRITSVGYVTAGFFSLGAVKKSVFQELKGFNVNLSNTEEIEFGNRLNQKYRLLLTDKVVGCHDDEESLKTLARKIHIRAVQRIPFYLHRKKLTKGFETPQRGLGMLAVGLSTVAIPATILSLYFAALFLFCVIAFVLSDFGQYRFAFKEKGFFFTLVFIVFHWLITAAAFWGFVRGTLSMIFSSKFREKYSYEG